MGQDGSAKPQDRKDFFISYNKADRAWAEWIAWHLEKAGYTTIIQAWDFRPGANFAQAMDQAARLAERTIAVLSPDYFNSAFTPSEWQEAFRRDPTGTQGLLLPIRVRTCNVDGLLGARLYLDLVGLDKQIAQERLLAGVNRQRAKPSSEPAFPGIQLTTQSPAFPGEVDGSKNKRLPNPIAIVSLAAQEDRQLLVQWEKHLLPLQQTRRITIWSEQHIPPGDKRDEQLNWHLQRADIIILLISADFFDDRECYRLTARALQRSQRGEARVIPLLLRPVSWRLTPIGNLSCLPTNGRPITHWGDRDEAFQDCVESIIPLLTMPVFPSPIIDEFPGVSFSVPQPPTTPLPTSYHSCFLSYANKDEAFAKRLHADLREHGVHCWFAPHDMKIGARIRSTIDQAIQQQDKVLLLLSQHSIESSWVEDEVEIALEQERREHREILFPINLDNAITQSNMPAWAKRLLRQINIGDFTNVSDDQQYQQALDRLLHDLKQADDSSTLHTNKRQIESHEKQIPQQMAGSRQLTTEDRQHQNRPILTPKEEIFHNTVTYLDLETGLVNERLYTSEQRINWSWPHAVRIKLDNMGRGPAFNVHCLLYGSELTNQSQFMSWNNGPIKAETTTEIELIHSSELCLFHGDSLDGEHPLYDQSLNTPSNPALDRIACLTITYHDLLGTKYMSVFTYTSQHKWLHIVTKQLTGEHSLDLKELNRWKKQAGPKFSAPPILKREN